MASGNPKSSASSGQKKKKAKIGVLNELNELLNGTFMVLFGFAGASKSLFSLCRQFLQIRHWLQIKTVFPFSKCSS